MLKADELLEVVTRNNQEAIDYNAKVKGDLRNREEAILSLEDRLHSEQEKSATLEIRIEEKVTRNRALHEKIAVLASRNQELAQQMERMRREVLSM